MQRVAETLAVGFEHRDSADLILVPRASCLSENSLDGWKTPKSVWRVFPHRRGFFARIETELNPLWSKRGGGRERTRI